MEYNIWNSISKLINDFISDYYTIIIIVTITMIINIIIILYVK